MDTRGHGRSPFAVRAFSYGLFAQDAIGLLDFLQIPKAAVIGSSDGAITGLQLAITKPDRISKLFAFGANSTLGGLGAKNAVFAAYAARCKVEYGELSPHPEKWPQLMDGLRAMWRTEPNLTNEKREDKGAHDDFRRRIRRDHQTRAHKISGNSNSRCAARNRAGHESFRDAAESGAVQSNLIEFSHGVKHPKR